MPYPTSLPSSSPATHQVVNDEIVAIATELGTEPSGALIGTVRDRIGGGFPAAPDAFDLLGWSGLPTHMTATTVTNVSGRQYFTRVYVPTATVTNLWVSIRTAAAGGTQAAMALFDASGTKVGETADLTTPFASTGLKTAALAAPYTATAGYYYVGTMCNAATTQPQYLVGASGDATGGVQQGIGTASTRMFLQDATVRTAFLTAYTYSTLVAQPNAPWVALS